MLVKFIHFVLESVASMFVCRNFPAQTESFNSAEVSRVTGGRTLYFKFILWPGAIFKLQVVFVISSRCGLAYNWTYTQ